MLTAGLIAGGVSAGGALLGGVANAIASGSANKRTIAYNKWALNQQRSWQNEDWMYKTSPQAQIRNMQAAGLNPGVIYGNGGAPQSDAGSVPTANPYEARPVNYFSGIGEATQKFMDASLNYANLQGKTIDNAVAASTANDKIGQQKSLTEGSKLSVQLSKETMDSNIQSAYWQAKNQEMQNFLMFQQRTNLELDADIKRYQLNNVMPAQLKQIEQDTNMRLFQMVTETKKWDLMDAQTKSTLAHIMIDQYNAVSGRMQAQASVMQGQAALQNAATNAAVGESQILLNEAKAGEATSNAVYTDAKTIGQRQKNEVDFRTMDYVVETTKLNLKKLGKDVDTYTLRNIALPAINTFLNGVSSFGSAAGNAAKIIPFVR